MNEPTVALRFEPVGTYPVVGDDIWFEGYVDVPKTERVGEGLYECRSIEDGFCGTERHPQQFSMSRFLDPMGTSSGCCRVVKRAERQTTLAFAPATPTLVPVEFKGKTIPEQFAEFDRANPGVYSALRSLALEAKRKGWHRASIKLFFERLRWLHAIRTQGSQYKLNNNWHAFYARKLMDNEDELKGFFTTRAQRCKGERDD